MDGGQCDQTKDDAASMRAVAVVVGARNTSPAKISDDETAVTRIFNNKPRIFCAGWAREIDSNRLTEDSSTTSLNAQQGSAWPSTSSFGLVPAAVESAELNVESVVTVLNPFNDVHPHVQRLINMHMLPAPGLQELCTAVGPLKVQWTLDHDYLNLANVMECQANVYYQWGMRDFEPVVRLMQWLLRWPMVQGPARNILPGNNPLGVYSKVAVISVCPYSNSVAYCSVVFRTMGYDPIFLDNTNVWGANCIRRLIQASNVFRWRRVIVLQVDKLLNIFDYSALVRVVESIVDIKLPIVFLCGGGTSYFFDNVARNVMRFDLPTKHTFVVEQFITELFYLSFAFYETTLGQAHIPRHALVPRYFIEIVRAINTYNPSDRLCLPMSIGDIVFVTEKDSIMAGMWHGWCMGAYGMFPSNNVWPRSS